jgi:nucleoside-diphosphate-sugar epimerase
MRVLVTGSRGYIGYMMVQELLEHNHEVIGYDRSHLPEEVFGRRDTFEAQSSIRQINKDIRDVSLEDLRGVDAVIHLAALVDDPKGKLWESVQVDVNYVATINLALKAAQAGVKKFIFASTAAIYGNKGEELLDEDSVCEPANGYALIKKYAEEALLNINLGGMEVTCVRNGTCFGISPRMRINMVLNALTAFAYVEKRIKISGDGMNWRPIVHIEDVARAYRQILEDSSSKAAGQIFNLGCGTYRIKDMAEAVEKELPESVIEHTEQGADKRSYKLSFEKIKKTINFRPKYTMEDGIKELVKGYREFGLTKENIMNEGLWSVKFYRSLLDSGEADNNQVKKHGKN